MEKLSIGQVVLATFPFSNLKSTKVRPWVVIGTSELDDIALCQITSQRYNSKKAVRLDKGDFAKGSIVTTSFIRPNKIATLDKVMVRRLLGTVTDSKLNEVKVKLKDFFEIS
jgi:mRNA interferase MazF